jgi:hypothetical protein
MSSFATTHAYPSTPMPANWLSGVWKILQFAYYRFRAKNDSDSACA